MKISHLCLIFHVLAGGMQLELRNGVLDTRSSTRNVFFSSSSEAFYPLKESELADLNRRIDAIMYS